MGQSFLLSEYFRVIEVQLVRVIEDRRQISLQILSELINLYSPWNHEKAVCFLMTLGKIKIN